MKKLFSPSGLTSSSGLSPTNALATFRLDPSIFINVDGSSVMLDSRVFNETPLNPKKCCYALTKLFYLLYRGGTIRSTEATNVFFAITKAFQSKDWYLRRLVYLAIKELSTLAKDIIIVTSSLTQDINSKADPQFRANAIRTLCHITDSSLITGLERFIRQSLVDTNSMIASAAIVSSIHLYRHNRELIKRWIQSDLQPSSPMTRYHALSLLFLLRQNDKMATMKLLQKYVDSLHTMHPYPACLLIRAYAGICSDDSSSMASISWKSLFSFTPNREMVAYEAARAICAMTNPGGMELVSAISVLQSFLSSSKPLLRFAGIRALNKLASTRPVEVMTCNLDMEQLITDPNRSIATLAITTLLKTGNDASVDRLMVQIKNYMPEISDELKINIVDAVGTLCLKFPAKYSVMLNFLGWRLRDHGSLAYKRAIVNAIIDIVRHVQESKEPALEILCEFVEDCEYFEVASDILHFLALEGPSMPNQMNYIRHIYNRLLLEVPPTRMAATGALIEFAVRVEPLRPTVQKLLQRCLIDDEDDIRDRALAFLNSLDKKPSIIETSYQQVFIFSLTDLEYQVRDYLEHEERYAKPLDLSSIPTLKLDDYLNKTLKRKDTKSSYRIAAGGIKMTSPSSSTSSLTTSPAAGTPKSGGAGFGGSQPTSPMSSVSAALAQLLEREPDLAARIGTLLLSSPLPIDLTEPDTEYVIKYAKHVFPQHIIFQFMCANTIIEQVLEEVEVIMSSPPSCQYIQSYPIPVLECSANLQTPNAFESCFVVFEFDPSSPLPLGVLGNNILSFYVKEKDPLTGEVLENSSGPGTRDEYSLQDMEVTVADFVVPTWKHFDTEWNKLPADNEAVEVFNLMAVRTIPDTIKKMKEVFGGAPCDQSDTIPPSQHSPSASPSLASHTLLLSGLLLGQEPVMIRCRMATLASGVAVEIAVRSSRSDLSQFIANAF